MRLVRASVPFTATVGATIDVEVYLDGDESPAEEQSAILEQAQRTIMARMAVVTIGGAPWIDIGEIAVVSSWDAPDPTPRIGSWSWGLRFPDD